MGSPFCPWWQCAQQQQVRWLTSKIMAFLFHTCPAVLAVMLVGPSSDQWGLRSRSLLRRISGKAIALLVKRERWSFMPLFPFFLLWLWTSSLVLTVAIFPRTGRQVFNVITNAQRMVEWEDRKSLGPPGMAEWLLQDQHAFALAYGYMSTINSCVFGAFG